MPVLHSSSTQLDSRRTPRTRRRRRRAFGLVELLIALSITATLLTAVMVALDASVKAYQATAESASRHTVARLTMHRLLGLIRTGTDFGPYPANVIADPFIASDYIEFIAASGEVLRVSYDVSDQALYVIRDPNGAADTSLLLTGVAPQYDSENERIPPFTLQYEVGPKLYRATIDLLITEDPDVVLSIEDDDVPPLRMVASTMPRNNL